MRVRGSNELDNTVLAPERNTSRLQLAYGLVLTTNLASSLYASFSARGLFADASALLVVIYEGSRPHFVGTRAVVDLLRQLPIVLLSQYSSASLFECGQAFSFVMLILPTILCALSWWIAPRNQKAWILFPLTSLLVGFTATSTHAIGEAAIATGYYWILLFVLLFRTNSIKGQVLFLLLCIPAFELHEGAFPLTSVLLLAIATRVHAGASHLRFVGLATVILAGVFVYQIHFVLYPNFPGDREHIIAGLKHFEFLYADQHFNLPLITGAVALFALVAVFSIYITQPLDRAARLAKMIAMAWALFALFAVVVAITIEQSFAPYSQIQARYHPIFVSALLGSMMILLIRFRVPDRLWMNPATIAILVSLCAAQVVADVTATRRWNAYVVDLQYRLVSGHGLVPWEATLHTGDERTDTNWRIFKIDWIIPYMCIIFAPNGNVNAMIDLPKDLTFRPLDPEKPDRLPQLRGIDFEPYKHFLITHQSGD